MLAVVVGFALVGFFGKPIVIPDSASYVNGSITRSPLIPVLIRVLELVLSVPFALRAFVVIQVALAVTSCLHLSRVLGHKFALSFVSKVVVCATLFLPQVEAARTVASESLSYSFLLFALTAAVPLLWREASRADLFLGLAASAALVSTRGQFVYLVPAGIGATLYFLACERSWRSRWRTLGLVACIPVAAITLQYAHTYPKVHRFARVALTGVQTMTMTLAASSDAEVEAIADPEVREFTKVVRTRAHDSGYLLEQRGQTPAPFFFSDHYNDILSIIYDHYFKDIEGQARDDASPEAWVRLDKITLAASRSMVRSSWLRLATFCAKSIFLWDRYLAVLATVLLVNATATLRSGGPKARFVILVTALWWVNMVLVAALEPPQSRYTFYFDELVVVLSLVFVARALARDPGTDSTTLVR